MPGLRFGKKTYKLGRDATERWHLLRTMATQLVEHERIRTTLTKAKAVRPLVEECMAFAKLQCFQNDNFAQRKIQGLLTTDFTRQKIVNELAPKFKDKNGNFTRIVHLSNRQGDNSQMAYIEFIGNEIEKYESALEKQQQEKGLIPDLRQWEKKTFQQERDFLIQKLEEVEEEIALATVDNQLLYQDSKITKSELDKRTKLLLDKKKFFEKKIQRVDHDLFIINKDSTDLIKFPLYS